MSVTAGEAPALPSLGPFSAAARAAGTVIVLGCVAGFVDGQIVLVIGGLALLTIGRGILTSRADEALAGAALAVMAGALGVAALRWGTLELVGLRSAQAVLGPTVLVGPDEVALAGWLASGAYLLALSAWLASLYPRGALGHAIWLIEAAAVAGAGVTAFWGPALVSADLIPLAAWLGRIAALVAVAAGIATLERRSGPRSDVLRWVAVALATVAVAAASSLVASSV